MFRQIHVSIRRSPDWFSLNFRCPVNKHDERLVLRTSYKYSSIHNSDKLLSQKGGFKTVTKWVSGNNFLSILHSETFHFSITLVIFYDDV